MLSLELQDWYNNWRNKLSSYHGEGLKDLFDRYITLFTIYNKLYNQLPDYLRADGYKLPNKILDSIAATQYVMHYLGAGRILQKLSANGNEQDIEEIALLIELEVFYIKIRNGNRDRDKDVELLQNLKSHNLFHKAKAILEVIYHVRCNIVHGSKDFQEYQKSLLIPLIRILDTLVQLLYFSLNRIQMEYSISNHGDWLEKEASSFITNQIPSYQEIWKRFIGHKGNGKMADMVNISEEDEIRRRNFAQHHYTVLESLYFMKLIVDDESQFRQVNSFDLYRKTINQIMAYQAYSGRLRDNIEKCFSIIATEAEAKNSQTRLDDFYKERHVFIHGRKVPFAIDSDKLFKISRVKKDTIDKVGFGLEMPWEDITDEDLKYLEDCLKDSFNPLVAETNNLLSKLLGYVVNFAKEKQLKLEPPTSAVYDNKEISGTTVQNISASINISSAGPE